MIHPLIKVLATRPELMAEHLAGYGELVAAQAGQAAALLRVRAWLAAGLLVGLGAGVGLGGVALMLWAAVPLSAMPMPALLIAVPLLPLVVAGLCVWALSRPMSWGLEALAEQISADAALLRARLRHERAGPRRRHARRWQCSGSTPRAPGCCWRWNPRSTRPNAPAACRAGAGPSGATRVSVWAGCLCWAWPWTRRMPGGNSIHGTASATRWAVKSGR